MRLINAKTLQLEEFASNIPEYAILSHTWFGGEVTLQDWADQVASRNKAGYAKIEGTCCRAVREGIGYVWVDTNCIDKTSSAELSEAINSMFAWYRDSKVCYVYLADVSVDGYPTSATGSAPYMTIPEVRDAFRSSRWFTRGWTLQELIAPNKLVFYSKEWEELGNKISERTLISEVTGIDSDYLRTPKKIRDASVSRRMSWMSHRKTTRVEDMAYCMLGIFDINMALLYGEGAKAFLRLQEEIIKVSNDQTIFCWQTGPSDEGLVPQDWVSILAPNPAVFRDSGQFFSGPAGAAYGSISSGSSSSSITPFTTAMQSAAAAAVDAYAITNYGLRISVPLLHTAMGACAVLDVGVRTGRRDQLSRVLVRLHRVPQAIEGHYVRLLADLLVTAIPPRLMESRVQIFVDCRNARLRGVEALTLKRRSSSRVGLASCAGRLLLLAFSRGLHIESSPVTNVGMDFHSLDSAVEVSHDLDAERGAIVLEGKVGLRTRLLLFIGARKADSNTIKWHVEIAVGDPPDRPTWELIPLHSFLSSLEEDLFGTWCPTWPLKSVWSWSYSDQGAVVCFLELNEIEEAQESGSQFEDDQFRTLRKSSHVKSSMQGLHRAASL